MRSRSQNDANAPLNWGEQKLRASDVPSEQTTFKSDVILRSVERTPRDRTVRSQNDAVEGVTNAASSMSIPSGNPENASNPLFWNILPVSLLNGIFYGDQDAVISR